MIPRIVPNSLPAECPSCGEPTTAGSAQCEACGARLRPLKRGDAAGVRIAHERLDALPDLELDGEAARWGKVSEPAPRSMDEGEPPDMPLRTRRPPVLPGPEPTADDRETPAPSEVQVEPEPRAAAAATDDALPAEVTPSAAADAPPVKTAEGTSPAPPRGGSEESGAQTTLASPAQSASQPPPPLDAEVVVTIADPEHRTAPASPPAPAPVRAAPRERRIPARPPVLASEALLRDLAPSDPAPGLLRFWSCALGASGLFTVTLSIGQRDLGVPLSALFLALLLLGLPPMPYAARAGAVAAVAGSGLLLALWSEESAHVANRATLTLMLAVTLLATGLLLRSWHRASLVARALVTFGLCMAAAHLALSDSLQTFTVKDTAWQSWEPGLSSVVLFVLLMLASLAFMDSRTTAGASVWSACMLVYFAVHSALELLRATWPKSAALPDFARVPTDAALSLLCAPLFVSALSIAFAQILAALLGKASSVSPRKAHDEGLPAQRPT